METSPRDAATRRVHQAAIAGAIFAALPLPITTAGLALIETRLAAYIAKAYQAPFSSREMAAIGAGLALGGRGLKYVARGASRRVPFPFGILIRAAIAGGTIEGLGHGLIFFYESRGGAVLPR
jgi:uncharacterized protein (DUF697 family)